MYGLNRLNDLWCNTAETSIRALSAGAKTGNADISKLLLYHVQLWGILHTNHTELATQLNPFFYPPETNYYANLLLHPVHTMLLKANTRFPLTCMSFRHLHRVPIISIIARPFVCPIFQSEG